MRNARAARALGALGAFLAPLPGRKRAAACPNPPRLDGIEPGIRPLVDALEGTGLVHTFTSCEGHYGYRAPSGDPVDRDRANVGFFLREGVREEELVRLFGDVLHELDSHGPRDAALTVAKRYVAALDAADGPEVFFEFTVRPSSPGASDRAKRDVTDRALAAITRAVERTARAAAGTGRRGAQLEPRSTGVPSRCPSPPALAAQGA